MDGTGRVAIHVEISSYSNGGLRLGNGNSNNGGSGGGGCGSGGFESLSRGHQGVVGVDVFEYRTPVNSPSNSAPAMSRSGTPRVRFFLISILIFRVGKMFD